MTNYGSEQLERAARIESTLSTTLAGAKLVCFCAEKIGGNIKMKKVPKVFRKSTGLRKPTITELLLGTALVAVTADDMFLRRDIKDMRAEMADHEKANEHLAASMKEMFEADSAKIDALSEKIHKIELENMRLCNDRDVRMSQNEALKYELHVLEARLKAYEEEKQ